MGTLTTWRVAAPTIAVVALLVCSAAAAFENEITGTVTDDLGHPVAGATIRLWAEGNIVEDVTNAAGAFAIRDIQPMKLVFVVEADGYHRHTRTITVSADSRLRLDVQLKRGAWISGKIVLASGEPVANANVKLCFPRDRRTVDVETGPDGTYRARCPKPGVHDVLAKAPGYASVVVPGVHAPPGQEVEGINFSLQDPSGSISGVVYDSDGKTAMANADVWAWQEGEPRSLLAGSWSHHRSWLGIPPLLAGSHSPPSTKAGPDGSFVLPDLDGGTYRVYAHAAGRIASGAAAETVVGRSQNVADVTVVLQPGGFISGAIYDRDGRPLTYVNLLARLSTSRGGLSARRDTTIVTDDQGRYSIGPFVAGSYKVEIRPARKMLAAQEGEVPTEGRITGVDFRLPITFEEGPILKGRVVDQEGKPIPGAEVDAYAMRREERPRPSVGFVTAANDLTTDAEGRFVVGRAVATDWRFRVKAPGYLSSYTFLEVGERGEYQAEIVLGKVWSGTLEGQILLPDGKTPAADTELAVQLRRRHGDFPVPVRTERIRTDAEGRFSFRVDRGIVTAKYVAGDLTSTLVEVDPFGASTVSQTVRLRAPGGVRGRIDPDAPLPADGAWVFAVYRGDPAVLPDQAEHLPPARQGAVKVTPEHREWQIPGLQPGIYNVFTYAPGLAPSELVQVAIAEAETQEVAVTIALPGTVTGRVTTGQGEPVADVVVRATTTGGYVRSASVGAKTDALGRYRLEGLTPGPAMIYVYAEGYARCPQQRVTVVVGETMAAADFKLFVGGEVSGTVRRRDGEPLTRRYCVALLDGPMLRIRVVRRDGAFRIENVYPGSYSIGLAGDNAKESVPLADAVVISYTVDSHEFRGVVFAKQDGITVAEAQTTAGIEFVIDE